MTQATKIICGFWDGKCQAMSTLDCPYIGVTIAEWIADGADIKTLPIEEAKEEFMRGRS